jgi:hypothetical protein
MMSRNFLISTTMILAVSLAGCGGPAEFEGDTVKAILEGSPLTLSNEQVVITDQQVACGAQNDLWLPPNGNVARLTQKGRDLKFTDDVRLNDPDVVKPYAQVNGKFSVQVFETPKVRDANGAKLADVKLGVIITNDCFAGPLPLMGIRKGKFSADAPVVFRFVGSGKEYSFDKLMH